MFPHSRTLMEPEELEEERRTCYVGITRAQRKLYMTYASIRTIFGRTEAHEPSRFLYEFPEELKEELAFRRKREDSFIGFGGNYDGIDISGRFRLLVPIFTEPAKDGLALRRALSASKPDIGCPLGVGLAVDILGLILPD